MSSEAEEVTAPPQVKEAFSLFILQLTREAQQRHGLRHGDYQRYRNYCSRRIRRIRQKVNFSNQVVKHRLVAVKPVEPEIVKDVRYLQLVLFSAERAWSYAMQLKSESSFEPRKRFHMIGRLRKAKNHASLLLSLCENVNVDARSKLEAQSYLGYIQGLMAFEMKNWEECRDSLTTAKTIYERLAKALSGEQRTIYESRAEELLPLIRYASYNLTGDDEDVNVIIEMRRKGGVDDELLDELISQTLSKQASSMSDVTWMDRTAPVSNEKVRVFLMEYSDAVNQLGTADHKERLVILERINKQCIDAIQTLRDDLLKNDPIFKVASQRGTLGQLSTPEISDGIFVFSYLCFIRHSKSMERAILTADELRHHQNGEDAATKSFDVATASSSLFNQTTATASDTVAKMAKPQDLVRLYDIVLQNLSEILSLPGMATSKLLLEYTGLQAKYRAIRCFYLARSYAVMRKFTESFALYNRCRGYIEDALNVCSQFSTLSNDVLELKELDKLVESDKQACRASSLIATTALGPSTTPAEAASADVKLVIPIFCRFFS